MVKNLYFFLNVDFDSSKEGTWGTERKAKNIYVFAKYRYWENQEKPPKMQIFSKKARFWDILVVFLDFLSKGT